MIKINYLFFIYIILLIIFPSCTPSSRLGFVEDKWDPKSEVVVNFALREFIKSNPNPKIVVRVPETTDIITKSVESKQTPFIINQLEKFLIKNGFSVKDRALLNNLMNTSNINYKEIGEKIDTDLIIEINSLDYNIPNKIYKFLDVKSNKYVHLDKDNEYNYINCTTAKLEGKIIIIKEGEIGCTFSFYISSCDSGIQISWIDTDGVLIKTADDDDYYAGYNIRLVTTEQSLLKLSEYFSNKVIKIFQDIR